MTVHTMRISSWVLRSGARRESIEAIQAFCACSTPGAHSCRKRSEGKGQTSSSRLTSSAPSATSSRGGVGSGSVGEPGGGGLIGASPYRSWANPGRSGRLGPGLGVLGLAEYPLGNHVALDLTGPAGDGEATGGQEPVFPALGPAVENRSVGPVEGHAHLLDSLLVFDSEQLAH